ncbi:MAG: hypothetical protein HY319_09390 [Armatimonadetes bacterium]|nr:hypothetical protein [Armatimonadota bacterium]
MKGIARFIVALMVSGALAVGSPESLAAPADKDGSKTAAEQQEEKDVEGMDVSFMDSTQAQWFNEAINAQLYHAGYTLNTVFSERDKARVEDDLKLYKHTDRVDIIRSSTTMTPSGRAKPVKLLLNGKLVNVSE